eukprot:2658858-Alexandrium_andersonii.AAC.1
MLQAILSGFGVLDTREIVRPLDRANEGVGDLVLGGALPGPDLLGALFDVDLRRFQIQNAGIPNAKGAGCPVQT